MNFYPHYLGDYARDTAHLSLAEHGAYRVMLDTCYATEKPLPAEKTSLYRICKAFSATERKAVDKVADEFFPVNGDGSRHNVRADEEIAKAHAFSTSQAERAKKGWAKRKPGMPEDMPDECGGIAGGHAGGHAEALPDQCPEDANHNHNQRKTTPLPPSGEFSRFWEAWPKSSRKSSRGKCWQLWRRGGFDQHVEPIAAHVEAMKGSADWRKEGGAFIPAPLVYLNQRRWEGADLGPAVAEKRMVI